MKTIKTLLIASLAMLTAACGTTHTVPITGRKTNLLVDDAQILSLSTQQYQDYMKSAKLSSNQANTAMVKRVGQRLANAVETYLKNNGYANEVAKHTAEQLSKQYRQQYAAQIGGSLLQQASDKLGGTTTALIDMVAQMGFNFANLKYSRNNETEADHLGLIFAAMAGYDPQLAIPFWQRMAQLSNNSKSEIFSDHPSDERRIADLQKRMPEALKYYTPVTQTAPAPTTPVKKTTVKKTTVKK